jgi:hypothetical protein
MHSRNLTDAERAHMARVKSLPHCSLCGSEGPLEAHHIEQGLHFATVGLCHECHVGPKLGWHGQKVAWKVRKKTELDALNQTIRMLAL